jgi:hypothetical protein
MSSPGSSRPPAPPAASFAVSIAPVLAFTFIAFMVTGIAMPVLPLHVHDRLGMGTVMVGRAPSPLMAILGAALTGFGYSLVYPGFGVEAVRRVPPGSGGLAMGAFTAFIALALGISGPALGWVASGAGMPAVFLVSTVVVLAATGIALMLLRRMQPGPAGAIRF